MSNPSPGTWRLVDHFGRKAVVSDDLGTIAILCEHDTGPGELARDDANARLILHAPELLESLKMAFGYFLLDEDPDAVTACVKEDIEQTLRKVLKGEGS